MPHGRSQIGVVDRARLKVASGDKTVRDAGSIAAHADMNGRLVHFPRSQGRLYAHLLLVSPITPVEPLDICNYKGRLGCVYMHTVMRSNCDHVYEPKSWNSAHACTSTTFWGGASRRPRPHLAIPAHIVPWVGQPPCIAANLPESSSLRHLVNSSCVKHKASGPGGCCGLFGVV